jgi:Fic family protein
MQDTTWCPNENWIDKNDVLSYICDFSKITEMKTKIEQIMSVLAHENKTSIHYTDFVKMKIASLVWRGNVLETGTGNESSTQIHIQQSVANNMLKNTDDISESLFHREDSFATPWHPEGAAGDSNGWKYMGEQGVKAYLWLNNKKYQTLLTVQDIKDTHQILMSGGMEDCGQFRTESAMTGDYVFSHPSDLDARMEEVVNAFNINLEKGVYPITAAIQLMLDFVTIHPFRNGNGRLCRLLFSYALQKMGFPFAVTLDSGFSKTYKHYVTALKMAQGRSKTAPLLQLAIISIHATLINYITYSNNPELKKIL